MGSITLDSQQKVIDFSPIAMIIDGEIGPTRCGHIPRQAADLPWSAPGNAACTRRATTEPDHCWTILAATTPQTTAGQGRNK